MLLRKLLMLFFLVAGILHAEALLTIGDGPVQYEDFKLDYYVDQSGDMPLEKVRRQDFETGPNRMSLGTDAHVVWVRMKLLNESDRPRTIHLHNTYAFHASELSYYLLDESGKTRKHISYQPRNDINTENMDGAIASFTVTLEPHTMMTVYMRSKFLAYQMFELKVLDEKHAMENLVGAYMWVVVLGSILFTLAGYYFILFFISRHEEYLYYSLYLVSSGIFISYSYGMLTHYFHLYGEGTLFLNAMVIISPVFLALFVRSIFNTAKKHPVENVILNSVILIFSAAYLYSFYDYYEAIELTSLLYVYQLAVMLGVAVSLYLKRVPLANYFLLAHLCNLIFSVIALMYYNHLVAFNFLTSHAVAIGTMIEALMLGFLVSYRIRILEDANRYKDSILQIDPMTTLYNRGYFEVVLEEELIKHRKQGEVLGLLVIDIDFFKQYNDTYGHVAGDAALREVAKVLKRVLMHTDDRAFRIGGEEFALICTHTGRVSIKKCVDKIQKRLSALKIPHVASRVNDFLTVSIGEHLTDRVIIENAKKFYMHADEALYRAKEEGRNRVVIYSDMTESVK